MMWCDRQAGRSRFAAAMDRLEPAGLRQAPGRPGSSGHCLQDLLVLRVFPGGPAAVPEMIAAAIAEGRRARGTLAVAGAGMRARSYHASPGEITSVGGCAQDSSMNCASTPDGGAEPADVPGDPGGATPGYQDRCRLAGWVARRSGRDRVRTGAR